MLKLNFTNFYLLVSSLILLFALMSCGKPLTKKEESFFYKLGKECNCSVSRKYDEEATSDFKHGPGWYELILTYDFDIDPYSDSLKIMSAKLAEKLNQSVLTDVAYPYNEITISHIISNKNNQLQPMAEFTHHYNNHQRFYPLNLMDNGN